MDPNSNIRYINPPIVEVVCEFRFVPSEPWDLTVPGLVYDRLRGDFPRRRLLKVFEGEATAETSGIRQELRLTDRMQFLRKDEKAFVQVGPNLLAVNHLAPYPTWEGFVPLVQDAYEAYCTVARPSGLARIGLRYVNRIVLPGNPVELADYLNFRPFVGPGLPQIMSGFILGVQIPFEDGRDMLRLQLTTDEPGLPNSVTVLLDIDYFVTRPEAVSLSDSLDWTQQAHGHIQEVFEACISDRLRRIFSTQEG